MKKILVLIVLGLSSISVSGWAEEFLGAPVLPGGRTIRSHETISERSYDVSQEQVLNFYQESFKDQKDLKFGHLGSQITIEDHGRLPWHKITISGVDRGQTTVIITKDSWTWIIGTLTIRFFGVFVVLLVLYLIMSGSTAIIFRSVGVKRTRSVSQKNE